MEQCDLLSFTSIVASLLLCKRCLTSSEIVNFTSQLSCEGFEIEDDWDNDSLLGCVEMSNQYSFQIKGKLGYHSILYDQVTVRDFLEFFSDSRVIELIQKDFVYGPLYLEQAVSFSMEETNDLDGLLIKKRQNRLLKDKCRTFYTKIKRKNFLYSFLGNVH